MLIGRIRTGIAMTTLIAMPIVTVIYDGFYAGYSGSTLGWAWHLANSAGWAIFWPIYWGWEALIWLGQPH